MADTASRSRRTARAALTVGGGLLLSVALVPSSAQAAAPTSWRTVSAGGFHTCAVTTAGSLWCWGENRDGQLGVGDRSDRLVPVQVGEGDDWRSVSAGGDHTCATRTDDGLWCWGDNYFGQGGFGATPRSSVVPVQVQPGTRWRTVAAGSTHSCGIRTSGALWCWGGGTLGQLGDGGSVRRTRPVRAGTGFDWTTVDVGRLHSCATRQDGTAWCWGDNRHGQLGDGSATLRRVPTRAGTAATWVAVTTGGFHSCGVRTDGSAWCWGHRQQGQLGDGTSDDVDQPRPRRVRGDGGWRAVEAGSAHTCGVRSSGGLWCWGANTSGQTGTGSDIPDRHAVPVQVRAGSAWSRVSAGYAHSCAVATDAQLWCWGANYSGALGDGTDTSRLEPVRVLDPVA